MEGNCLKVKIECYKMNVELNVTTNYGVKSIPEEYFL